MSLLLSAKDRKAVDLVMDRSPQALASGRATSAAIDGEMHQRVGRISAVLALLAEMPAPEPPGDLLARTLAQIERAPTRPSTDLGDFHQLGQ